MQVKKDKMIQGWKETILGEVAEVQTGPFGSQLHEEDYVAEGTPIITVENLINDYINNSPSTPKVSDKDKARLARYILNDGDIVFSRVGSVDRCAYVSSKEDGWLFSGRLLRVRPAKEMFNKYVFYWISQQRIKKFVRKIAVGATMPSINTDLLSEVPISYPPLPEQKAIAAILSSFDDKIELLRRQNKTLEKIAQTIFKEWFVNFEFPNEKGKPYKSSGGKMIDSELREIPEGWRVGTVNDVIERFSITYRCDKDDLDVQGKTPIIDQGSNGLYGYTKREPDFLASAENPVVVFANHTCNMWFINYPFCAIQNIIPFRGSAEYSTFFVFYMTLEKISFIEYKGHWPDFEQKEYVIPKPDVANKFAEIVKPFKYKIWNDNSQIQTLSRLRDYLLPKLMKGEIRVKS